MAKTAAASDKPHTYDTLRAIRQATRAKKTPRGLCAKIVDTNVVFEIPKQAEAAFKISLKDYAAAALKSDGFKVVD